MDALHLDPQAKSLLAPVSSLLDQALARLPSVALHVEMGVCDGTHTIEPGRLVLSDALLGGVSHPDEPAGPVPPLDRWRRAAGAVLEAAATTGLCQAWGLAPSDVWWWRGLAVHLADRAAPDLALADPDLACAVAEGQPGAHPRSGVAVARAWEARGLDPTAEARALAEGKGMSASGWVALGEWVMGPSGPRARLPVDVGLPTEIDIPATVEPWSWVRLHVPAHPRGGRVRVRGPGAVADAWARGGRALRTLAGATHEACTLEPLSGGPVGRWEVASAEGYGQVMGARGITYVFHADGRLEIVMADAAVGPLAMLEMAVSYGTSGVVRGRWRVAGVRQMWFSDIDTTGLTMHGRQQEFAMPAQGFGMNQWLGALHEHPWSWARAGERLTLQGTLMGGQVEVRLDPPAAGS